MTQMQQPQTDRHQIPATDTSHPSEIRNEFGKSVIRLRLREWFAVVLVVATCFIAVPKLWERWESSQGSLNDRVPYAASEDYWAYRCRMRKIAASEQIPVIGDSVVWGEYVSAEETLSAFLNRENPMQKFANAGLNGAYPLALSGLVDNYAGDLQDGRVILHCNLLWMSSPERDLQSDDDVPLNHTRLIPQFYPRIASYKAPFSQRLGIVIDRSVPFFDLVSHVRIRYFEGKDVQSWTIANPYANPFSQFERDLPRNSGASQHDPVPWTKQGIPRQDLPWVELSSSVQWRAWRQTALRLRSRRNRLLVLAGPFNEHLLLEPSRRRYESVRQEVEAWLRDQGIPCIAPAALPSEEYGDASHPLSAGYARLARSVSADRLFREWLGN